VVPNLHHGRPPRRPPSGAHLRAGRVIDNWVAGSSPAMVNLMWLLRLFRRFDSALCIRPLRGAGALRWRRCLAGGLHAFGDLPAERDDLGNLAVRERLHEFLALHRFLDEGREFFSLLLDAFRFFFLELGHHFAREEVQRFADMLVLVAPALLDEGDLIDAGVMETAQMLAQELRRADAAFAAGARRIGTRRSARLFERTPDVGAARCVLAETVVMAQRVAEEAE